MNIYAIAIASPLTELRPSKEMASLQTQKNLKLLCLVSKSRCYLYFSATRSSTIFNYFVEIVGLITDVLIDTESERKQLSNY